MVVERVTYNAERSTLSGGSGGGTVGLGMVKAGMKDARFFGGGGLDFGFSYSSSLLVWVWVGMGNESKKARKQEKIRKSCVV